MDAEEYKGANYGPTYIWWLYTHGHKAKAKRLLAEVSLEWPLRINKLGDDTNIEQPTGRHTVSNSTIQAAKQSETLWRNGSNVTEDHYAGKHDASANLSCPLGRCSHIAARLNVTHVTYRSEQS